jgi:arylsulfatase A-like enzyme
MLSALLACCLSGAGGCADGAPNLVVLYVDDLSSAWELPTVDAPNLHALADRGVRFSRAYASHPLCIPSRTALLAGQRTMRTQVFSNSEDLPPSPVNGVPYLPERLHAAGYHTAGVGKVFHYDEPEYWDEFYNFSDDPWVVKPTVDHTPFSTTIVFGGAFLNDPVGSSGKMADTKRVDETRKLLQEAKARLDATGQRFAIFVGLEATHGPFIYPEKYLPKYEPADVPPLPEGETATNWKSAVAQEAYSTDWFYDPAWGATEEEQRVQAMLAYFRCISYIDEQVGRVLSALHLLGLDDDTIVVFVSDHGQSFSEHAHIGKTTGYDQDVVAPLIVAVPWLTSTHGRQVATPVAQVDVYPTLMELLGVQEPAGLDGTSLVPQLLDVSAPHPPVFYTTDEEWGFNLTRYVVKRDDLTGSIWKLGAWEHDAEIPQKNQLYDLTADPGEYANLYADASSASKVAELRAELAGVGLLGPSARNFSVGVAGACGVPALTWTGVPALGARGVLELGNSSGRAAPALLVIGLSGTYPGAKPIAIKNQLAMYFAVPPQGLSLPLVLPTGALFEELPIGMQLVQIDAAAPCGLSRSRALSLFLSH